MPQPDGGIPGPANNEHRSLVTASDSVNPDLFWALRGGGGSTFGVVTAVTVKAWPQICATATTFTFTTSDTLSTDAFWSAMYSYWKNFPTFADAGTYGYFRIWPIGGAWYFGMTPFFAPNMTVAETEALLKPWTDDMESLGIDLDLNFTYYDNFHDAWYPSFPIESVGGAQGRVGSRLFPRENWANETIMNSTFDAIRSTTEAGYYFTGFNMKNERHPGNTANSANPAWRRSLLHGLSSFQWSGQYPTAEEITEMWRAFNGTAMAAQRAVTPGSGAYLGEVSQPVTCEPKNHDWWTLCVTDETACGGQADILEPDFQHSFWGVNYGRLLSIKQQRDPSHLFYATTGVGSESWVVETADGLPTQDGKLCRAA